MNKLLLATTIFFASYAGTIAAVALIARKMFLAAAVSYALGWLGWVIAFAIGGRELVLRRKKYKKTLKSWIKKIIKSDKNAIERTPMHG